eukprot:760014-Hanusia_phi.AAC.3
MIIFIIKSGPGQPRTAHCQAASACGAASRNLNLARNPNPPDPTFEGRRRHSPSQRGRAMFSKVQLFKFEDLSLVVHDDGACAQCGMPVGKC